MHVLINNAGILRDKAFKNMTDEDWDLVTLVHLKGAYSCTKACWGMFRNQKVSSDSQERPCGDGIVMLVAKGGITRDRRSGLKQAGSANEMLQFSYRSEDVDADI